MYVVIRCPDHPIFLYNKCYRTSVHPPGTVVWTVAFIRTTQYLGLIGIWYLVLSGRCLCSLGTYILLYLH
jgi:hypothetical protein